MGFGSNSGIQELKEFYPFLSRIAHLCGYPQDIVVKQLPFYWYQSIGSPMGTRLKTAGETFGYLGGGLQPRPHQSFMRHRGTICRRRLFSPKFSASPVLGLFRRWSLKRRKIGLTSTSNIRKGLPFLAPNARGRVLFMTTRRREYFSI